MYLILYLLLPLVIASDVVNSGQNTRDVSRALRRSQRRAKSPTTTTEQISETTDRAIGPDFVPREIFKFELADAKIPDFHPQYQQQRYKTQQSNEQQSSGQQSNGQRRSRQRKSRRNQGSTSTKTDSNVDKTSDNQQQQTSATASGDQSGADSRLLHVAHLVSPTPTFELQRQRGMKQLPFNVAKAINQALKQDFNIPFLDTIKYYFKDPAPKTTKLASVNNLPPGAKLFSDSRIKQWWQLPPFVKSTSASATSNVAKISSSTIKPGLYADATAAPLLTNEYVAYPLLRSYPVQYSLNVASDLVNGVGFLYGDRIYAKPYTYQKNINHASNSLQSDIKPVVEPKPEDDEIITGVYHTTQDSIRTTSSSSSSSSSFSPSSSSSAFSSSSSASFPSSSSSSSFSSSSADSFPPSSSSTSFSSLSTGNESPPKSQSYVKYYTAELPIPTKDDTSVPLSSDKNTIDLINKAVSELKKHNPHLDVVPKRIENDELIVHVTPKPDYFHKSTSSVSSTTPTSNELKELKELMNNNKNLVYLNKLVGVGPTKSTEKPFIGKGGAHHAYVTHVEVPANLDDLIEQGYQFGYRVRDHVTGTDFGHTQKRMTDGVTMGEYKILMPDGRMQNVKYKADDNGYQADVSYDV